MFTVTDKAQRPARMDGKCFYCLEQIGATHKETCVLVKKRVRIKMTITMEVDYPNSWDKGSIEFHRNDGSWCAGNVIDELAAIEKSRGCLCATDIKFEYLEDVSGPVLDE